MTVAVAHQVSATARLALSHAVQEAVFRGTDAGPGFTVSQGHALMGELGLVVAPGGDILTVNGGNGNLVEVSPYGM